MKLESSGPLNTANCRLIVKRLKESPRFFPLASFFSLEEEIKRLDHVFLASRERLLHFGEGVFLAREVVGAPPASLLKEKGLEVMDFPAEISWQWALIRGKFYSWESLRELEKKKRQQLPWRPGGKWRLRLSAEGAFFLQHFRQGVSIER